MWFLNNIDFERPWVLILTLLIPLLYWLIQIKKVNRPAYLPLPDTSFIQSSKRSLKSMIFKLLPIFKYISLGLLIFALAGPRLSLKEEHVNAEGIDIMIAMDVSVSMLSEDFDPNRLEAAKKMAEKFIDFRKYDRIGLVIFSGEAFTFSPLTSDHEVLNSYIDQIQAGILKDGTAIGNGLASAVNRLKNSTAKSKVIILLTDGMNNTGYIDPLTSIDMAKQYNIKVYTIGVGTNSLAKSPVSNFMGKIIFEMVPVQIDEQLLKNIASSTGGLYYRAKDNNELKKIYENIDELEKTKIETKVYRRYTEEFEKFLILSGLILLLVFILENTLLKKIP